MTKLGYLRLKQIIVVIATIGLVISSCYLFQPADNAADATTQFRATIIVIAITYTFWYDCLDFSSPHHFS